MQTWGETSVGATVDYQPASIQSSCGGDYAYSDGEWEKENPTGTEL